MAGFDNEVVYGKNGDFTSVNNQNVLEANGLVTDGKMWIGTTAVNAGGTHINVGSITSPLGSVTIGFSTPNITIDLAGGGTALQHLTGNSGGALNPDGAFNINTLGTGSITIAGVGSTLTTQLTGLTNHAVLVGAGTATITKLAVGTNGQVLIASTAADPAFATITSTGGTIAFTLGANTLNMEVAAGGLIWVDATSATQALLVEHGYVTDRGAGVTYTLPASAALGDIIKIVGKLGIAVITPNAGQQILIGSTSGTVGVTGTATANNVGDCIELVCITAGASTVWRADSVVGTWTLA